MNSIWRIVDIPVYPTDSVRKSYFFTEMDTVMTVTTMAENKKYKESLILLRSVFEKFLYFWLMFKGVKFKWTYAYKIVPKTSSTPREARDKTVESWQELRKSGDPKYANWEIQKGHKEDVIFLTNQEEGIYLTKDGVKTDDIVPIYNNMLNEYEPDIKHLSDIENKARNMIDLKNADELTSYQDQIYNHYIYITNIFRNLRINNLVDKFGLNIIRIHYNFLSKYVHPSKYSLELWDDLNKRNYGSEYTKEQALKELVLFYCTKLMQLYFREFISGYKDTKSTETFDKFQLMVKELEEMSQDFWFFDNKPSQFDLIYSESIKKSRKSMGKIVPEGTIYNEDPLDRLMQLRMYSPT